MAIVTLSTSLVLEATGGRLAGGAGDRVFDSVSTDTRTIGPGALFLALRGDRFDGHAFVDEAVRRGAAGLVVAEIPAAPGNATVIAVADTLAALQALGRDVRRRSGARVVAITGSAGKTTTKEITASLLAARYRVFRNHGNLNNHIGLPLSLLELRHGPDVAVVELGMNHAGEIHTLVGIAAPDVRVWTNVGDAHIGHFGSREAIARAKAEILDDATAATLVIANADDPLVMAHVARYVGRTLTFGESAAADVRARAIVDRGFDGTVVQVDSPAGALDLHIPLPGRAHVSNVLAAVAVATALDVDRASIEHRVSDLRPVSRRGSSSTLPNGVRLIDDSYNASPAAVHVMLQALAATATRGRRVAILGEMRELGDQAAALHESCGRQAASIVDALIVVGGPAADAMAAGAIAAGLPPTRLHRYASSADAALDIARLVTPGDLVLVKGSRGTRTDLIVDRLQEVA